jgi:hypothetical protein
VSIKNADDEGIEFVMVAVPVLNRTMACEYEELKIKDVVLTDDYADVVINNELTVNETVLTVIRKDTVKYKRDQCFKTDMVEVALTGMEFPDSMRLLSDPHIWIGDTAASVHTSPYKHGMIPKKKQRMQEVSPLDTELVKKRQCMETLAELCVTRTDAQWDNRR